MFPRRERLPRALFAEAIASGRRLSSAHFSAILPHTTKGYAVIVPKKVARLSVTRHRLKRRVLAALRTLPLPPSLILFPRASAARLTAPETRAELVGLLSHSASKRN